MNISYLLIGGNEGDRDALLNTARENIGRMAGSLRRISSIYETEPWGKSGQPDFLNQALELMTELDAHPLMNALLKIEQQMGRRRFDKYGARLIDIDILFFNDAVLRDPGLTIPHPEIPNRRFVLTPLAEIAPFFEHPLLKRSVVQMLADCKDPLAVKKITS